MADKTGQAEIRGINIDKAVKGFAEAEYILRSFLTNTPTSAREIRWYQKTAGTLDSTDTTAITASQIANVAELARPVVIEPSYTRMTSYVRKYFVESPFVSIEDIDDSDPDVWGWMLRDLTLAILNQIDTRCFNVLTESLSPSTINNAAATGTGWDDTTNGNPVLDVMTGLKNIRSYNYDISNVVLYINPIEYTNLLNWIIAVKGSSIPNFSSEKVGTGVLMNFCGCRVVASNNATTDYALMFVPQRAATWKSFKSLTSAVIVEEGIGKKVRIWEEGECLLTDPRAVHLITDTVT